MYQHGMDARRSTRALVHANLSETIEDLAMRTSRSSRTRSSSRWEGLGLGLISKIGKISKILQIFGGLVLGCIKTKICKRKNMRLTAFFKLYKMCILLQRCNLKVLAKNRFEKTAIFVKIQQQFCKCFRSCKQLQIF